MQCRWTMTSLPCWWPISILEGWGGGDSWILLWCKNFSGRWSSESYALWDCWQSVLSRIQRGLWGETLDRAMTTHSSKWPSEKKTVCQQSNPISVGVVTKVVQFQVQKRRKVTIVNRRVCNWVRFTVSTRKDVQGMYLDGRHTDPND